MTRRRDFFCFCFFFAGSVVIWRENFCCLFFVWICWWEDIEFIWPTWIRHLILWVLFMPQNVGGDPIKGKFFIVLVIKKNFKELIDPAWIYRAIDSKNQTNRTFGYYCAAKIWIHMIMNSSTIPLNTAYASKRRKTSNKRQVCYCFYWKKRNWNSC